MARHICIVAGTRPEAIKLAPLITLLRKDRRFNVTLATTGQHTKMLDQAFQFFDIQPNLEFNVMDTTPDLLRLTERTVQVMADLFRTLTPDMLLVQGDTTTAMVAAIASFYKRVPLGHVEAGLRSRDLAFPFPEEANRRLISVVADINFAPTWKARQNLIDEGIPTSKITTTGNTVIDALLIGVARHQVLLDPLLEPIMAWSGPIILVTAHRRESWGAGMIDIAKALKQLSNLRDDLLLVLPMHRNPVVRDVLSAELSDQRNIILTDPLDYGDLCTVLNSSSIVLTDSGGLQEEAPALGKPVLVLRSTTERPEGVATGNAILVGTTPTNIVEAVTRLLDDPEHYRQMSSKANPYGDGKASARIVQSLAAYFGLDIPPDDFNPDGTIPS